MDQLENILAELIDAPETFGLIVNQYKPVAYAILDTLFGVYKDFANNDEWFDVNAAVIRKRFDALVATGFTEDQAMAIMLKDMKDVENYLRKANSVSLKSDKSK